MSTVDVAIPFERGVMPAALARPNDGAPPYPGVVVAHDLLGLGADMLRIAERFAARGYVAVAPDLYSPGPRPLCIARTFWALARGVGAGNPSPLHFQEFRAARSVDTFCGR